MINFTDYRHKIEVLYFAHSSLVPYGGTISNRIEGLLAEGKGGSKDFCEEFEQVVSQEACDELFQTLAQWNHYLENHVEGFGELEL